LEPVCSEGGTPRVRGSLVAPALGDKDKFLWLHCDNSMPRFVAASITTEAWPLRELPKYLIIISRAINLAATTTA
jgi:hypothetical protein